MCIEANHYLSKDMDEALKKCSRNGKSTSWKKDFKTSFRKI